MKRAAFVVNPGATPHRGRLEQRCYQAAREHGWVPELMGFEAGEGREELYRHLRQFAADGDAASGAAGSALTVGAVPSDRLVFAVGGDGTVRACAHALAGTNVPLAVVARGTGNLFAKALGLPSRLDEALAVGFDGADRWVDLGSADGETFTAMAGIGVDAAVVASTPRALKDHLGWLGYAMAAVPQLGRAPHEMVVRTEGHDPVCTRAQSVVVGNVGVMPGGFAVFPGASMEDGLLDVGVLYPKSVMGWALMARTVFSKGHFADRYFSHLQGPSVKVTAEGMLPRQLDGDSIAPGAGFEVTVMPRALRARVPAALDAVRPE